MNDTTKWIMIVLLLLLIAAAVVVLLRSPGKDRDGGDEAVDRVDDDRAGVQDSGGERLAAAPERGVYDQEADHREGGAHPVGQDEPVAAQEPSTYDRQTVGEDEPAVDEAPSQEPPASAGPGTSVDDSVTYADDIEATSGPEAAADRDATGDDDVAAEPYRPEAGAYEGGEPGTYAEESYRPGGGAGSAEPMADAEPGTAVEQHPTEELTAGDTEGYGGPAPVADTTPDGEPTPATDDDSDRLTQAARIGALGAAGGAVAGAATTGDGTASARPLSDEEVSAGARHEPLEVGDQEHPEGSTTSADEVAPDQSHDEPAADERTHDEPVVEERTHDERPATGESHAPSAQEPLTADEVVAASGEGQGWSESSTTEPTTGATAAGARGAGYETDHSADGGTGTDDVDSTGTSPVFAQSVYGPGSADPLDDGTGPAGWAIKGNVGSMLFHTTDSPSYDAVRAEVWFESEEAAREAGFAHWDRRRR